MKEDKKNGFGAYPRPSTSDEQQNNQDEFVSQKPNERSPVSGKPGQQEEAPLVKKEDESSASNS